MVGHPVFRLIPPELHDEEHALLARIRAGEHIAHYETTRVRSALAPLVPHPVHKPAGPGADTSTSVC